ncbi:hypothetical protein R50073_19970 [Maricurvus nonylphenolicus]|uniref:cobalt-precorrin 5A hydrolase n=1 Tax=Maricurvus nonylphenolicus TaxID=1008307 RepID=UPI0036F24276
MIRIVALTEAGARLGQQLQAQLRDSELWVKPKPFADKVQGAFTDGDALILICATGIAVRTLAPVLVSKHDDPPVLVLDEAGRFVIPLLSGHEGGANEWGREVSNLLAAELVITTAQPYLQPVYSVGMGCERGCPEEHLRELLMACLEQAGLSLGNIQSINSIDIKTDEVGLITLAESLDKPFQTWNAETLNTVDHLLNSHSDYVFKTVGVYGVAESAALIGSSKATDREAELVLVKQKTAKATCAIARSYPALG